MTATHCVGLLPQVFQPARGCETRLEVKASPHHLLTPGDAPYLLLPPSYFLPPTSSLLLPPFYFLPPTRLPVLTTFSRQATPSLPPTSSLLLPPSYLLLRPPTSSMFGHRRQEGGATLPSPFGGRYVRAKKARPSLGRES